MDQKWYFANPKYINYIYAWAEPKCIDEEEIKRIAHAWGDTQEKIRGMLHEATPEEIQKYGRDGYAGDEETRICGGYRIVGFLPHEYFQIVDERLTIAEQARFDKTIAEMLPDGVEIIGDELAAEGEYTGGDIDTDKLVADAYARLMEGDK